jgi:two-component system alkaline phosphatase synthesis response regulator PhoP
MRLKGVSQCANIRGPLLRSSKMQDKRSAAVREYTAVTEVFIMVADRTQAEQLKAELTGRGFDCIIARDSDDGMEQIAGRSTGVVLLEMEGGSVESMGRGLARRMKQNTNIPVIAMVSREQIGSLDNTHCIDDFVVKPWDAGEIAIRIKRVLRQNGGLEGEEVVKCGDLVIDSAKCEVRLNAKPVALTFREYQLLKFLASHRGKVFTREVLLNKVWGWDYYGGDRTVDVHIRRLRSKIEDMDHSFIETIRNIGYRFIEPRA